eukprot:14444423-Ditylum_brightwellii.AAC.1
MRGWYDSESYLRSSLVTLPDCNPCLCDTRIAKGRLTTCSGSSPGRGITALSVRIFLIVFPFMLLGKSVYRRASLLKLWKT